jgi:fructokinase
MILSIGEILYDIFPEGRRLGGAPFNFAYHLKKLGYPVRFISKVGPDEAGEAILRSIADADFLLEDVGVDRVHDTGWVKVSVDKKGLPGFHIVPDMAYDYIDYDEHVEALVEDVPELIYFGSLIQRTSAGFQNLHAILDRRKSGSRLFYDMNLRDGCRKREIIEASLTRADILKLNDEELQTSARLLGIYGKGHALVETFMKTFDISVTALTCGAAGSCLYMNGRQYPSPPGAKIQVENTVGAGDGYAALLAAGILDGLPPEVIVNRAARFSSQICTLSGTIPESDDFYNDFRKKRE